MVEWLAGNRIRGTSAEKPVGSLQSPSVGGWKELGRTTLNSSATTIDVSSLADKRYLMVLLDIDGATTNQAQVRFNGDATGKYAYRLSDDGGADFIAGTQTTNYWYLETGAVPKFTVAHIANLAGKEKLTIRDHVTQSTAGSGTSPRRRMGVEKWVNTIDPIDQITSTSTTANGYGTGSEMVVLGWDPADTHTTNFWEELASAELSSASMRIDSGTFTAKKYLWIQIYNPVKISGGNSYVYFNNVVTGTTHSGRSNTNGRNPTNQSLQSDYELTSSNGSIINHDVSASGTATGMFTNMFVINNASNEKLSIIKSVSGWTNAGSGVAPARFDCVGKWANTTDAITSVQCGSTSVSTYMGAGSIIKVWGHD